MFATHLYYFFMLLGTTPALGLVLIAAILLHYNLRRWAWKRSKRKGRKPRGYYPSSFALGLALQFIQVYHRPSMEHVRQEKKDEAEDADEDEDGDPDTPAARLRHFHRQLRRIRRGDPVDRLVLRT
jgi:hypothetical protein